MGGWLRFANASTAPLEEIESYEYMPIAMTLSWDHHPARMAQHGAAPVYLIRLGSLIFGESNLGLRMMSILAGTATIALLYLIAARWWGPLAGLLAATLLAFERYHIGVSARAIDLPFDLFFITLAMYCFSEFLRSSDEGSETNQGARWLYGAAAASALGFLCKELTALMVPALFLSLISTRRARWLRRPAPWLAAGLFALMITPDVYTSLTITPAERGALYERQQTSMRARGIVQEDPAEVADGYFMSYGDQLSRFRSVGFNREPFYFYFGDILNGIGVPHQNEFDEFPFMHPILACIVWAGVATAATRKRKDVVTVFLLTMFVVMLLPFTLVTMGAPHGAFPTDSRMLWYWVDRSMLPAVLLTSHAAAMLIGRLTSRRFGQT